MTSIVGGRGKPVVTLDLWLTLVAEEDGTQQSQRRYEARTALAKDVIEGFGLSVNETALLAASSQISQMVTSDHDLGIDLEFSERVAQLLNLVDPELSERLGSQGLKNVADAIDRAFIENPPAFLPGAKNVLDRLNAMDLSVALISNTGLTSATAYRKWFSSEDVVDKFDMLTFSNEIACAKPNPGVFLPTLEGVGGSPEYGLHIGDNLLTDISGAASIGMKTGWISGHDDREPMVEPDYVLSSISELPDIVEHWLSSTI